MKEEEKGNKQAVNKIVLLSVALIAVIVIAAVVIVFGMNNKKENEEVSNKAVETAVPVPQETVSPEEEQYTRAAEYEAQYDYQNAAGIYLSLGDYKDSKEKYMACLYNQANGLYQEEKYVEAKTVLEPIKDGYNASNLYSMCDSKIKEVNKYEKAKKYYDEGEYSKAKKILKEIKEYAPAKKLLKKTNNRIENMPPGKPDIGEFYDTTPNYGDGTSYTVEWEPVSGARGYEWEASETIQNLDEEPYYWSGDTLDTFFEVSASDSVIVTFKVRAYKYIGGNKKYGPWSRTVYCYLN